jgi:hypothetical protein
MIAFWRQKQEEKQLVNKLKITTEAGKYHAD